MKTSDKSVEKIDLVVGMRLRRRRLMLGISYQELSKSISLSVKQIKNYENATSPIASSSLYSFAKLLNVPIKYFVDMSEPNKTLDEYLFELQNDSIFQRNLIAEDAEEYSAPAKYDELLYVKEKEISSLIRIFTKIQNSQIRQKIVELVELVVKFQSGAS
jgi:transcriptional regulator with XRE-family HTH domain